MCKEFQKRKPNRLSDYDYSQNGAYFITICTKDRQPILSKILVGRDDLGTPENIVKTELTSIGMIADKYINSIEEHYGNAYVDKYVVMPDHIHILISIKEIETVSIKDGVSKRRAESTRPTEVSQIVGVLKRLINKEVGKNIFKTSFYDHIIRDENDYMLRVKYIEENPVKWIYRDEIK